MYAVRKSELILPGIMPRPGHSGYVVIPGSSQYLTPGGYNFTTPQYNTFNLDLRAAGGGGGAWQGNLPEYWGAAGDHTYLNGPVQFIAYGGGGGPPYSYINDYGANGASGSGANGTVVVGGGGAGGRGAYNAFNPAALSPRWGGAGGRVYRTFVRGEPAAPVPGTTYFLWVGAGGVGAWNHPLEAQRSQGEPGANGAAYFSSS